LHKNVKKCKNSSILIIQVIHIENTKKGGKISVFQRLSTLSTLNGINSGDYSMLKKEQMFCEVIIKMHICRKKSKKTLTFENLIISKKFAEDVYMKIKSYYNKMTEKKRRCQVWHRLQRT
jgi:hypothetical protein